MPSHEGCYRWLALKKNRGNPAQNALVGIVALEPDARLRLTQRQSCGVGLHCSNRLRHREPGRQATTNFILVNLQCAQRAALRAGTQQQPMDLSRHAATRTSYSSTAMLPLAA